MSGVAIAKDTNYITLLTKDNILYTKNLGVSWEIINNDGNGNAIAIDYNGNKIITNINDGQIYEGKKQS